MNPLLELIVRSVYFGLRVEPVVNNIKSKFPNKIRMKISIDQIDEKFKDYGIKKGDTIMVHSSLRSINASAEKFIEFLLDYIGEDGNIMMPTHPALENRNFELVYDIKHSKSRVGYLTEYFRNYKGVKRSLYPFSSVAVWGKDQDWILENNLNENKPLPHGVYSPYNKLALLNGFAVCIGVTAKNRATIKHCAEEILDKKFPVKNFFEEKKVEIHNDGNDLGKYICRIPNLRKSQIFVAKSKIEKEWLNSGALVKYKVNEVPLEFVDARKCVEYMKGQIELGNTSYPFAPIRND